MGEVLWGMDFRTKKRIRPIESPLQDGLKIIAQAMSDGIDGLAWPGMDVQAPYMSPEKDPA